MLNRFMQPLRVAIQWGFLLFQFYLGVQFYRFVLYLRSGATGTFVERPDGIEGFLPISALLSVKDWTLSGDINPIHPAGLVIFLAVLTVSLLLKRAFCSWICPVGTLSEMLWKGGFSLFKGNVRLPRWLDNGFRGLKYVLLAFFLYGILWRMPLQGVKEFIYSDYNKIADVRLLDFFLSLSATGIIVVIFLTLSSLPLRNPFCRYLCPYGALLGLLSTLSPVKVGRDRTICVSCGVCTQVCPANLPVMQKDRVHSPECVGCWRCISHCRAAGALGMRLTGLNVVVHGVLFAALVVGIFWGGSVLGKLTGHWHTAITPGEYVRLIGR